MIEGKGALLRGGGAHIRGGRAHFRGGGLISEVWAEPPNLPSLLAMTIASNFATEVFGLVWLLLNEELCVNNALHILTGL
jgi:hypothetical protein